MNRRNLMGTAGISLALLLANGGVTWAEESAGSEDAVTAPIEEILITSRKRTENLMAVPSDITVVNQNFLKNSGAASVTDMGYGITGVFLDSFNGGSGITNVSVRGISGAQELTGVRSGIGFFVDGVNVFNQTAFNTPLLDVERVEILKGPQPAAFGRSVIGGAINLITRKPPEQLTIEGDISYGNYDTKQARITVGGPISEKVRISLSGLTLNHDGYLKNLLEEGLDAQSADMVVGKVNLLFLASDKLTIQFIQDYFKDDGFYGPRDCADVDFGCAPGGAYDRKIVSVNNKYRDTSAEAYSGNLKIDYDLDSGHSFTAISAYRYNKSVQQFDIYDNGGGSEYADWKDDGSWEVTQEMRIASPDEGRFTYLVGGLFTHESLDFHIPFINPIDVPEPLFPELGDDLILDNGMKKKTDVFSVFASGKYDLTERLKADVGVRFTHEKTKARTSQSVIYGAGLTDEEAAATFFNMELFDITRSDNWDNFEGQLALSYNFSEDAMIYGRVSQGKKSGGFTQLIIFENSARENPAFGPETLIAYEIGVKAALMDGKLRLNASAFYNDYDDIQVRYVDPSNFNLRLIQNGTKANSKGVELEANIHPNPHISIVAGMTYQKSEFTTALPTAGIAAGNEFTNTPKFMANLAMDFNYPINDNINMIGGVNAGYRTRNFHDAQNDFSQERHAIVNARAGLEFMEGRLTTTLWAKNLTDKTVSTFMFWDVDNPHVLTNAPRTYGIEVGFKY